MSVGVERQAAAIEYIYKICVRRWFVGKGSHRVGWELQLRIGQSG
jgi:hypothetical protein